MDVQGDVHAAIVSQNILCVDSGGTHTRLCLLHKDGHLLPLAVSQLSGGLAQERFATLLSVNKLRLEELSLIGGFAGLKNIDFSPFPINERACIIESDARLGLRLLKKGLMLIAGTGSVCIATDGKNIFQSGGKGPLHPNPAFRDIGSGFFLGSFLGQATTPSETAKRAPEVFVAAKAGEKWALDALKKGAFALSKLAEECIDALGLCDGLFLFHGSLFSQTIYRHLVWSQLKKRALLPSYTGGLHLPLLLAKRLQKSFQDRAWNMLWHMPPVDIEAAPQDHCTASSPTEQGHPLTHNLSAVYEKSPKMAAELLLTVARELTLPPFFPIKGASFGIVGAGSSGRAGIILERFFQKPFLKGFMAGGSHAFFRPQEGSEDARECSIDFGSCDCIIGISASGSTPFVHAALQKARQEGRHTLFIHHNTNRAPQEGEFCHALPPPAIAGSTRLMPASFALAFLGRQCGQNIDLKAVFDAIDLDFIVSTVESIDGTVSYLAEGSAEDIAHADIAELGPTFDVWAGWSVNQNAQIKIPLPSVTSLQDLLVCAETCKLISTLAHLKAKKVWGNSMIDVVPSNEKLRSRALRMMGNFHPHRELAWAFLRSCQTAGIKNPVRHFHAACCDASWRGFSFGEEESDQSGSKKIKLATEETPRTIQ